MYNLPVEQMHAPVVGPLHANQKDLLQGRCSCLCTVLAACCRCLFSDGCLSRFI